MVSIHPYAAVFALLSGKTRPELFKRFRLRTQCMEGKNPPGSRIDPKLPVRSVGKPSIGQQPGRERVLNDLLDG